MALEPVAAPPATPPRLSLLTSAQVLDNGERWQGGVKWEPEQCGVGGTHGAEDDTERTPGANPATTYSHPFYVWASDEASSFGYQARDWQGRARRQLEATQSFGIAREMWAGAITTAEDAQPSPFLADGDTLVGSGGATVFDTVAAVETWAGRASMGRRQMVHLSPLAFATYVRDAEGYVMWSGNVAVTMRGTILVTDDGYPGTPPAGQADDGSEWVISSPLVTVRLDTVEIIPTTLQGARDLVAALEPRSNTITVWAQRLALYQLDRCNRFAAPLPLERADSVPPTPAS